MKKILILSLIAVGLAGCHTADRTPYMGSMGEYGFTHDLNSSPSPFVDTSYRPLTAFDLAAPIIVVVTNRPPPRDMYQTAPETAVAGASGQAPGAATTAAGITPQINEAAGAPQSPSPTGPASQPGTAGVTTSSERDYYDGPDTAVSIGGRTNQSVQITNTNSTSALNITNTNNINVTVTNTVPNLRTNQPDIAATNNVIRDAAGTQRTNQFTNQLFNSNNLSPNPATPPAPPVAPTPSPVPQSPPQGAAPDQTQP